METDANMKKGEAMDYGTFEKEALRFCRENGIDVTKYQALKADEFYVHMRGFVGKHYKDGKEAPKICEMYGKKFWEKFRR